MTLVWGDTNEPLYQKITVENMAIPLIMRCHSFDPFSISRVKIVFCFYEANEL